jgi:hypothetical protein
MTEQRPSTETELVELIRSIDVPAPESLHRQVQALVAEPAGTGRARSGLGGAARSFGLAPRLAATAAITAAVVAIALVVGLSGGASSALSERETAPLTQRAATERAPAESPTNRTALAAAVDGVSFPYWEERFGWRSTGARTDRVDGRTITTVFYADGHGRRIGYAIVAGSPAPRIGGGLLRWRNGTLYRLETQNGAPVVSWLRSGHLCVVSGRDISGAMLLRLASWGKRPARAA